MIAIHHSAETNLLDSFSTRWIDYCEISGLDFKIVDCYKSTIIKDLNGVTVLLWHAYLRDNGSFIFATNLIRAIEKLGIRCFPNLDTYITYDNKIAQKYLFEALAIPNIPTEIYYDKQSALNAIKNADYPFIFKLSAGAGSNNVIMVKSHRHAKKLVHKLFGRGMPAINRVSIIKDRISALKKDPSFRKFLFLLGSLARLLVPSKQERESPREHGYFYMQKFLEGNAWDSRLIVIGERCFGVRRNCRPNDFRASGSGNLSYESTNFPIKMLRLAFESAKKLDMQSVAFDFIKEGDKFVIIEISYCFVLGSSYDNCPGFWTEDMKFHQAAVDPQRFILEDILGAKILYAKE